MSVEKKTLVPGGPSLYIAPAKRAYSLQEIGEIVDQAQSTLYLAIADGRLRAVKAGRRTLVLAPDLETYIATFVPIEPKAEQFPADGARRGKGRTAKRKLAIVQRPDGL